MKFLSTPTPDSILEATEEEVKELCVTTGGFMLQHKEAWFWLVYGKWIMILSPKEEEKEPK